MSRSNRFASLRTPLRACLPLVAALLAACAPDGVSAPVPVDAPAARQAASLHRADQLPGRHAGRTRALLEQASAGLTYTSEGDYPFTYVAWRTDAPTPLDVATFRRVARIPADVPVEVVPVDDFLARHIERVDPYDAVALALVPRYVTLRETIHERLREPVVFRVGRIAIDCYIVGTDPRGNVAGLSTVAIET